MRRNGIRFRIATALAGLAALGFWAGLKFPSKAAAPEPEPSPPYLLLHDWYGESPVSSPSYIRDHFDYLESLPFDGIVTYVRSRDLEINVSARILGTEPVPPADIESCLAPIRGLPFRRLKQNFAAVLGGRPPDFMDDWSVTVGNFAALAEAAREAGLRGIYFDNEGYDAPWADHPGGVRLPDLSLSEYVDQARRRGREAMEAMVERFPDIVVLVLHGPYISEMRAPHPLFPQWQTRNELHGPFFAGLVEGAGARATVVDGGEIYHLRDEMEFRQCREWRSSVLPSADMDCAYLPAGVRSAWPGRVRFAFGVYDRPFQGRPMDPKVLASTLGHALRWSNSYVWLYVEGPSFLKPPESGGAPPEWIDAVRRARNRKSRGKL